MDKQDIILFSTADWNTLYWTNKQHMAKQFAKLGYRVLYIESMGLRKPKIKSAADWKRIIFRLMSALQLEKKIELNIWVMSPLVFPFNHRNKWIKKFNKFMISRQIEKFIKVHKFFNPMIWTYHPHMLNAIENINDKNTLIYHCVDDLSAVPGVDKEFFTTEEKKLLQKADIVFVTSKSLEKKCSQLNKKTFYFPNVVDFDHFSDVSKGDNIPEDLIKISEPRVVFLGALSEFKIDLKLLDNVIKEMPKYNFVFIGEEIEGQGNPILKKISKYQNSYFIGSKSYELLPKYLSHMQVGVLPVIKNSYTDSMAPMKFLEYIAAGLPVVVSEIEYLTSFDPNKNIFRVNEYKEFVRGIKEGVDCGPISISERIKIINGNTWRGRSNEMIKLIEKIREDGIKNPFF